MSTAGILALFNDAPVAADDRALLYEAANDIGNARRLIARHGPDLIAIEGDVWACWDDRRYRAGQFGKDEATKRAQRTADSIRDEARLIVSEIDRLRSQAANDNNGDALERIAYLQERSEKHWKFAVTSGNAARVRAMLEMAAPHRRLAASQLDADPFKFNCINGTMILAARAEPGLPAELQPHVRKDLITKLAGVAFDPDAKCPLFLNFLNRILPDPSLRRFLQVWLGYCLSGATNEQKFVILYGTGANGKSVLLSIVKHVMGDYAATVPIETFMQDDRRRGGEATPDIVRLVGARLVTASEPAVAAKLSESMVKTVTGEEAMTARALFKEQFEFLPAFKLMLAVNIKPVVRGQDEGIWRRIVLVPFEVIIPPAERDHGLLAKLKEEAPGILAWMFEGFLEWLECGLPDTPRLTEAVEEYRTDSDPIGEFMRTRTRRAQGWRLRAGELYKTYLAWVERNLGDRKSAAGPTLFGRRLSELGYVRRQSGDRYYEGLALIADPEDARVEDDDPERVHNAGEE